VFSELLEEATAMLDDDFSAVGQRKREDLSVARSGRKW
jgi:hypothetical protein